MHISTVRVTLASFIQFTRCIWCMQVQGVVQDRSGRTVATLFGKWDESMHYVMGDCFGKGKGSEQFSEAHLLWKRSKPPQFPTRYNLTRFAITLNELTPGLKVKIIVCIKLHLKIIFLCSGLCFKHVSRKNCHRRTQDYDQIRDASRMVNMKGQMLRSWGLNRDSGR